MNTKQTNLSPRLLSVASFVPENARIADIGTDHARLPVYLLQKGIIDSAIAADIGKGPLEKAAENLKYYGLSGKVELRLADGLAAVGDYECDLAVIAGMGGELIAKILYNGIPKGVRRLVLQPMTDSHLVREAVTKCGMKITAEDIVPENGKMYVVIAADIGKQTLTLDETYVSPAMRLHPLCRKYIDYRIAHIESGAKSAIAAGAVTDITKEYEILKNIKL